MHICSCTPMPGFTTVLLLPGCFLILLISPHHQWGQLFSAGLISTQFRWVGELLLCAVVWAWCCAWCRQTEHRGQDSTFYRTSYSKSVFELWLTSIQRQYACCHHQLPLALIDRVPVRWRWSKRVLCAIHFLFNLLLYRFSGNRLQAPQNSTLHKNTCSHGNYCLKMTKTISKKVLFSFF